MSKSGVRYGQRTKQQGQSDIHILITLKEYLRAKWGMNFYREWYVGFTQNGNVKKILQSVSQEDAYKYRWRNPDLLCVDAKHGLIVIEVDGKVHDIYTSKTQRRNEMYNTAGIKLVILNLSDIIYSGKSIFEYLDIELGKLGIYHAEH